MFRGAADHCQGVEVRAVSTGNDKRAEGLSGCRILVVEDEYFLADDMFRVLSASGAEIIGPIGEANEALAALDSQDPIDCAILDVNLRGEMVYPVASALRSRNIPFVFATGYDQAAIPTEFHDVPRWEKPFDPDSLVGALPSLVRGEPE
jgi:CheY-like chemotaxis protein